MRRCEHQSVRRLNRLRVVVAWRETLSRILTSLRRMRHVVLASRHVVVLTVVGLGDVVVKLSLVILHHVVMTLMHWLLRLMAHLWIRLMLMWWKHLLHHWPLILTI